MIVRRVNLIPGNIYNVKDINTYEELHSDVIYIGCSYVEEKNIRKIVLKFRYPYYPKETLEVDIEGNYITEAN